MKPRIGIARALYSYYHYPLFKTFLEAAGGLVIISPKTTKEILKAGNDHSPAEICLPVKAFLGHIAYLKDKVDYLFIPRIVYVKNGNRIRYGCPKAIGLPDLVRSTFDNLPPILELNWDERITSPKKELINVSKYFSKNGRDINYAYEKALQVQLNSEQILDKGLTSDLFFEDTNPNTFDRFSAPDQPENAKSDKSILVGLIGHPYLLFDNELGFGIFRRLKNLGISVISPTMLKTNGITANLFGPPLNNHREILWIYEQPILASADYFLYHKKVDGLLLVSSFACGTSAVVNEIIHREIAKYSPIPILTLLLDEHTAEAGIITRIESFIDLISLAKNIKKK